MLDNEVALHTGGAKVHSLETSPVRSMVMVFIAPRGQDPMADDWENWLAEVRDRFESCVRDDELALGSRLWRRVIRCDLIAQCVYEEFESRARSHRRRGQSSRDSEPRGILILAVDHSQIGLTMPDGGLYVAWHPYFVRRREPEKRIAMYLMPPSM